MILLSPNTQSPNTFHILEVDRQSVFAGKLGQEVRETWKVEQGGHQFTIIVSPYHTRVAGTPRPFSAGDDVRISIAPRGERFHITISQARH